jgi:hypothetical protein
MLRPLIGLLGAVTAVIPDRMLAVFESIAIENPDATTTRPWIHAGIRAEGLAIAAASLVGGRAFAWLMNLTGAFGLVLLVRPETYRRLATTLLYDQPRDVEWNEQFTRGIRLLGVLYVLLGAWAALGRRRDD